MTIFVRGTAPALVDGIRVYRHQGSDKGNLVIGGDQSPEPGTSADAANGDVLRVEVRGTSIRLKVNGAEIHTWEGITAFAAGTYQGLVGSNGLGLTVDEFLIEML